MTSIRAHLPRFCQYGTQIVTLLVIPVSHGVVISCIASVQDGIMLSVLRMGHSHNKRKMFNSLR